MKGEKIKVQLEKELSAEFLGDVMVTAFDGTHGSSWYWCHPAGRFAFHSEDHVWTKVQISLDEPVRLSKAFIVNDSDTHDITHEVLAKGIERIINDDYFEIWREATEDEKEGWLKGDYRGRKFRLAAGRGLLIETGETARGCRDDILRGVMNGDAGEIDAESADAIVQVGFFGKAVFG